MAMLAIKTKTVENPFQIQGLISVLWLHLTLLQNMISKSGTKTQMNHTHNCTQNNICKSKKKTAKHPFLEWELISDCTTLLQKYFKDWNKKMNHHAQLHLKTDLCKSKKNLTENHKIRNQGCSQSSNCTTHVLLNCLHISNQNMNYAQNCVLKTTDVDDPINTMQQKRSEKRMQASFKNAAKTNSKICTICIISSFYLQMCLNKPCNDQSHKLRNC